ncbi:MAG: iron(III) transport system substrate-binding protein [Alphaproteobacteria bacterium]|jgi:iron(III) transport system substrate-binding protein|nr:iron(III) transport system substrate-binding protein [Alphaproteobacteria bacterium]
MATPEPMGDFMVIRKYPIGSLAFALLTAMFSHGADVAMAQTRTLAEIASYQGSDRTQRLIDGAKQEGTFTLYSSTAPEDMNPVIDAFKQRYGIEVQFWRSSSDNLLQRAIAENRAGRCLVDAFTSVAAELEALQREKLLYAIKTPLAADLMPQAIRPHGEWITTRLNIFSAAYNTNLVKKDEVPKSYDDLKDPKWKGRLAIEVGDSDWFSAIVPKMGKDKALKLFSEIALTNGFSYRKGHTLLANLVAAGEVPLALTTYNYKPEQLKKAGAPIEPLYLSPLIALPNGAAVSRCATHPNAAVLFYDFMVGEAQEILAKRDFVPTNRKLRTLPEDMELTFVDPAELLDHSDMWTELWEKTILRPQ